jgi:serine/threonine-protein kinase HipA
MLKVWTDKSSSGLLDRHRGRGTTFVYDPKVASERAVSVTMPVRTASWDAPYGLAPIFDMNLPEGSLRTYLMRRFAKATGTFDDFDLLAILGRTQIGRIRYSAPDAQLSEDVPFQSIDEILRARRGGELFNYLLDKFAVHSGLSGIQPKIMIRGVQDDLPAAFNDRQSQSFKTATHIVKFWEPIEYPELAANEYFCLSAAKALGLMVPEFQLSDDGLALVLKRFDLQADGLYLGYEDFCVLNGFTTAEKYKGGYETRLFKRAGEFIDIDERARALEDLFKLFVLNCAVRNGDAHLKNFGIIYDDVTGPARLAPVYDVVSTQPYLPQDAMALTLNGSTNWPDRRTLTVLGQTRSDLTLQAVNRIFEQAADVLSKIARDIEAYFKSKAKYHEIGDRILAAWGAGIRESLGFANRPFISLSSRKTDEKRPTP